jgi:hypothetical protein
MSTQVNKYQMPGERIVQEQQEQMPGEHINALTI